MTHPNFQTNGASLEDCHTNFFALTELSGIKWRKLVWSDGGGGGEPLDDPILRSYARCLAADILCVWRRVPTPRPEILFELGPPTPSQPPPLSLAASKELWIFWYQEEPDLGVLVAPELIKSDNEQGSWESGLSYECRSLLFKALHNLIERCLLSRDFVRLGKWFVLPYEGSRKESDTNMNHLTFSLAFFVHGESTVCASIDVRQHPPIRKLSRFHLQQAQASSCGLRVILAPFGLIGTLTGQTHKTCDANTKFLDDWSSFFPLDKSSMSNSDNSIVEVIVGDMKMKYPSCYVLVTDYDDPVNNGTLNGLSNNLTNNNNVNNVTKTGSSTPVTVQTPPLSPIPINTKVLHSGPFPVSVEHPSTMHKNPTASTILPERVWQECILGGPPHNTQSQQCTNQERLNSLNENAGQWEFNDPTKRTNCTCSRCRKYVGNMSSSKWSSGKGNVPRPGKGVRGRIPFHRRSPVPTDCVADRCSGSYTPQGGPPSYPRTQESMAIPSVGSPASVEPSPLPNPHSQPASIPPGDQVMPTLSPNPPTIAQSPADKTHTPDQPPASTGSIANSPQNANVEQKFDTGTTLNALSTHTVILKKPVLYSKEYETALGEEEHSLDLLYDYSTLDAWYNHPVKRFKPDSKENQMSINPIKGDLYSMCSQNGILSTTNDLNHNNAKNPQLFNNQEIKQEPVEMDATPTLQTSHPHGIKRPGDPYEFDEEGGGPNMEGYAKRGAGAPKEEAKDSKKGSGNLYTSEGLQPSYKDLDQIFDNSDDTSGDEALQIQTPPGSNTSTGTHEDTKRLSNNSTCSNMGILRPEELSKMFPTPPSLEHNPIASPCGQIDLPPPDLNEMSVRVKQDSYPNMGSPTDESIDDWSFVFKPPPMSKMVGSSKYAPLTFLPSQSLPPVSLPSHCVYKPSWMQHMEKSITQISNTTVPQPVGSRPNSVSSNVHQSITPYPPSPLHAGFRPPPPPYELPSPATSTASSYLNKNLNSVDPESAPSVQRAPEANSLVVNILLGDTALNIFRDHNFDSCTLCVCHAGHKEVGNIKGSDAGVYLLNSVNDRTQSVNVHQPSSPFPNMATLNQPPPYGSMLSPQHQPQASAIDEDSIRCSCGFSAVRNRKLSHRSGLFYEDEMEITGIAEDPSERKKGSLISSVISPLLQANVKIEGVDRDQVDVIPHGIIELVREQCVMIQSTANSLYRSARYSCAQVTHSYSSTINILEFTDANEITCIALEQSKHVMDNMSICKTEDSQNQRHGKNGLSMFVHKWPFLRANGPQSNQDILRVMKSLQPLLQEAIQKKETKKGGMWEAPAAVKGPLTWRQFHRLAGRGTDDRCEPQPVPALIVGHEKDWISLSPYAVHHWERLLLEPYSYARDIAYIVVAPDNEAILPSVRTFFKELSTAYEMCRLGRHSPITKVLRDGILRVGKTAKAKLGNEPVEDWFTLLGESETTDMLKLYAQVCKHHLAPHLQQVPMDKTLLDPPECTSDRPTSSPMPPPSTPDNSANPSATNLVDKAPLTPKVEPPDPNEATKESLPPSLSSSAEPILDEEERQAPSVIIYMVEPFSLGCDQADLQRLACLALLRCFQSVLQSVPESIRSNINVQIISQESIMELGRSRDRSRQSDHMRALALSMFSQCRRLLVHTSNVKSLTGFGTAAAADLFLKNKDDKNRLPYRLYTPPYILAPIKEKVEPVESFGLSSSDQGCVLYLSYCLSEDQSWLLAVVTDERGEIFESITINIDIPNRIRRKKASARRAGLQKLMDWALGIMSLSVKSWRLVIGRVGRIGHGELKGWSWLLSRKNLLKASKHLKEICNQCALMYPSNVPCILSACLVSLEPDSTLRLMPDHFTPDDRFSLVSVNSQLSTPQDVTCTHILVFPTSATTQSSQTAFQEQHINGPELGDEDLFGVVLNDDIGDGIDGMNDFSDIIFNWTEAGPGGGQSPTGSPRREESGPGSPNCSMNGTGRQGSPFPSAPNSRGGEPVEEVGTLLQQPLALGYLVSTAPTGRMPKWFWASCPHLEDVCPAFLKNALHLHSPAIQQSSDDLLQQAAVTSHPLDSQYTTDVLRHVLEGYNALSWLAFDSNTQDRLSCLPVHIQVLVQLYHTTAALL